VLASRSYGHACALSLGPAAVACAFACARTNGLPTHLTAALWLFNVATNWLGFAVLGGFRHHDALDRLACALGCRGRGAAGHRPRAAGGGAAVPLACRFGTIDRSSCAASSSACRRCRIALLQCALSVVNWGCSRRSSTRCCAERVPFDARARCLLASAVALAVLDVPRVSA
jgi:hypothetical protein